MYSLYYTLTSELRPHYNFASIFLVKISRQKIIIMVSSAILHFQAAIPIIHCCCFIHGAMMKQQIRFLSCNTI